MEDGCLEITASSEAEGHGDGGDQKTQRRVDDS
jgi:hypothetical protein